MRAGVDLVVVRVAHPGERLQLARAKVANDRAKWAYFAGRWYKEAKRPQRRRFRITALVADECDQVRARRDAEAL